MYICSICGNKKYFIETNCTETEVTLDESDGAMTGSHDTFVTCERVACGVCGASSEEGNILSRDTGEPVNGGTA
jgi:hypothetical protein